MEFDPTYIGFYEGEKSKKRLSFLPFSPKLEVVPFAAVHYLNLKKGNLNEIGVGVYEEYVGIRGFYGCVLPRGIIASFRAVKILEMLPEIKEGDLELTFDGSYRNPKWSRYAEGKEKELFSRIGEQKKEEIFKMVPKNLDRIIRAMQKKDISVDFEEIAEEVKLGVLKPSKYLSKLLEKEHFETQKH